MSAVIDRASVASGVRAEIAAKREEIESDMADLNELKHGYLPAIEVEQRFNDWLNRLASQFNAEHLLNPLLCADGKPQDFLMFQVNTRPGGYSHHTDLGPMLAFLFGDQLKERMAKYIESLDCPDGPPLADRPKLIEKLEAKILSLEITEEALIVEAERNGIDVSRHPNANPAVVLEWQG